MEVLAREKRLPLGARVGRSSILAIRDHRKSLKRQGLTNKEIGDALGYHPATISNWLRNCGPPPARTLDPAERVINDRWAARIRELLRQPADKLLATSVYEIIRAEGFDGSYPSVVRFLRDMRGRRGLRAEGAVQGPAIS